MEVILATLGPTRAEAGCRSCELYLGAEDGMKLTLVEQWETSTDLERHIKSNAYRKVLAWIEMSKEAPQIRFDTVTESRGLDMLQAVRG